MRLPINPAPKRQAKQLGRPRNVSERLPSLQTLVGALHALGNNCLERISTGKVNTVYKLPLVHSPGGGISKAVVATGDP